MAMFQTGRDSKWMTRGIGDGSIAENASDKDGD